MSTIELVLAYLLLFSVFSSYASLILLSTICRHILIELIHITST